MKTEYIHHLHCVDFSDALQNTADTLAFNSASGAEPDHENP